ncbi:MAG: protein kinase [Sandaracinaceae bacterium]
MSAQDRLIGGRYRIVRKIAEGGMGEVYEAQHNLSKKAVALKILFPHIGKDEAARQRFLREVSAPAQIGHDQIVEVYDAGFDTEDGALFVAMEFLQGEPFRDRLAKGGHSMQQILDWFEECLDPLAAAHESGIVHRDLKPENIFVQTKRDGTEVIKVLDFGIARDLDSSENNVTHTGIAMGTPHYMAPEQAMSAKGVTAAADVWAMGAMLYEALAGQTPFQGETASAIVVNACTKAHAPLCQIAPSVPPALGAFVDRCLDKEPGNRPQDARMMLAELRRARGGGASTVSGSAPGVPATQGMSAPGLSAPGLSAPGLSAPGLSSPGMATGPAPHQGTGPVPGQTPAPGYTPAGTALLPAATPPPGWGPHSGTPAGHASMPGAPGSAPGYGTAAGYGTPNPSGGGYPSHANYASPPSSFGAPGSFVQEKKSGGGMAMGLIALVLAGGLVVLGGGVIALVAFSGGDDEAEETESETQVRIDTNVAAGELIVDGESRGPVVSGQQIALNAGHHALEIRENGQVVSEGSVNVVSGQAAVVAMNRMVAANSGGPPQIVTGQLRPNDERDAQGKYIDRHSVSWTAGQVRVDLDSADFDTYLQVISPSGRVSSNDDRGDGSLNSTLMVAVTEPGQWTIVVTSFSPNLTGDYTLRVQNM